MIKTLPDDYCSLVDEICPWNFSICTMPCLIENEEEKRCTIEDSKSLSEGPSK